PDMFLNRSRLLGDKKSLGRWGEKRAERFLRAKGLKTLARNYSCKSGELDLVMVDTDSALVFVEVRTRADGAFGPPEQTVTYPKKLRLIKTARYFLTAHEIDDRPFRFDVLAVTVPAKGAARIEHFRNAFSS
ncbi:MAG: YraN family protein, partial [Sedimentisphaerales bacterium]|nr:YraN family protein [Sedimentisphaerales bacterium]